MTATIRVLWALLLMAGSALAAGAQTPSPAPAQWQPRPLIIVDPRSYLRSPTPYPKRTPRRALPPKPTRHAAPASQPETFERLETSPAPASPRPR